MSTNQTLSPPLSLYIHIPWCVRKCPYCDFNSHQAAAALDENRYIEALLHDLDFEANQVGDRTIQSIFFGGGTPSLFSARAIARILDETGKRLKLDSDIEITLEANPGTVEQGSFAGYRSAGINRLSIGIQSFDDDCLKSIGRIHDAQQALGALSTARSAGFDNINLDLMFGLPGQSLTQAENDVRMACEQGVQHLSHYQLTIEANTFFYKHPPQLPETELMWDMQESCQALLSAHGYTQYEVSAYANQDHHCRHNLNYWNFGDYIGIGAGAHGKLSDRYGNIKRRWKHRQPEAYMTRAISDPVSGEEQLESNTVIFEFLLNALRLKNGCSFKTFEHNTGLPVEKLLEACREVDPALLQIDATGIRTSEKGYLFLNDVLQHFIE